MVFFGEEAGFEGDPRPHHKWAKLGSRQIQNYYGGHAQPNVVGSAESATGRLDSLIVTHCNTEVLQAVLNTMTEDTPPNKENSSIWFSTAPACTRVPT